MKIYKLFYTSKKRFNPGVFKVDFIKGKTNNAFGLEFHPDTYSDFLDNIYHSLHSRNIEQHVMTTYKFMEFIKKADKLDFKLGNVILEKEEQLYGYDGYECLKDSLNREDVNATIEYLDLLVQEAIEIKCIEGYFIKEDGNLERLNIYSNGTISTTISTGKEKN